MRWWPSLSYFTGGPVPDPIYEAGLAMDAARVVEAQMKANQKEMIRRALEREEPMRDYFAERPTRTYQIYRERRMSETSWEKKVRIAKERRNIAKAETKRRRAMRYQTVEFDFPTTAIENSMRHEWERPLRGGLPANTIARALVNAAHAAFDMAPADLFDHIRARRKGPHDLVAFMKMRCTEAQFARFLIERNNNGGCNSFKELNPCLISVPVTEPPPYIDVRPRA